MGIIGDLFGSLLKPLLVALLFLIALSLLSDQPGSGTAQAGFSCPSYFSDPELNRLVCRFHPVRIWNMPVRDLLPWVEAQADAAAPVQP